MRPAPGVPAAIAVAAVVALVALVALPGATRAAPMLFEGKLEPGNSCVITEPRSLRAELDGRTLQGTVASRQGSAGRFSVRLSSAREFQGRVVGLDGGGASIIGWVRGTRLEGGLTPPRDCGSARFSLTAVDPRAAATQPEPPPDRAEPPPVEVVAPPPAAAPGVPQVPTVATPTASTSDRRALLDRLLRLELITEAEYQAKLGASPAPEAAGPSDERRAVLDELLRDGLITEEEHRRKLTE